ncbi:hypothetical protein LZ198_17880 [Myxococcus sp. K15C18031901]|uniref:hypothetical protein n=1 Tax=Myxococcus dinghuensis TaxID=2906761 RepID=UPI0020A71A7D|nr:hypothetical protein [Myxococcus dinghuensis]MCP3100742.1 hypothetical protein [Myxococcus dinghuensis]
MSPRPLKEPLAGEHVLQVEPPLKPFADSGWRSRPHLYTGRALSAEALAAEQRQHSGWIAVRGQVRSPGVVSGLEVGLDHDLDEDPEHPFPVFTLEPGMGLTASGEDVHVPRALRVRVDQVPVYRTGDSPSGLPLDALAHVRAADTQYGLRAAVLVMVPVVTRRDDPLDPTDPGEVDLDTRALDDHRLVDGCTLVLFAWPAEWPLPEQDGQWRNRLAWEVFERERQRPHGQHAPWEEVGVPLALVGFESASCAEGPPTPVFVDRATVVRPGGAPRSRTPLLPAYGTPLLWQARIQQLSEHLAAFIPEDIDDGTALQALALLPPVGQLPRHAISLELGAVGDTRRFFPSAFDLDFRPVPLEQLDAVAKASGSLTPLDTAQAEHVQVLVPVPESHFEPYLLREEEVAPAFQQAIDAALARLEEWLGRRQILRRRATLLLNALSGDKSESERFPGPDPQIPGEHLPVPNPYGSQEGTYETQDTPPGVPLLDETLLVNGTWAEPGLLGGDNYGVSTARVPDTGGIAVLSRSTSSPFGTYLTSRRLPATGTDGGTTLERIFHPWGPIDFKLLYTGSEPVIVLLARGRGNTPTHLILLRKLAQGWEAVGHQGLDVPPTAVRHFTAVSFRKGGIDAFVATNSGLRKFTWIDFLPQAPQQLAPETYVHKVVALCPGELDVEVLFLGSDDVDDEPYWLHHISGRHEGGGPELLPRGSKKTLTPVQVTSAKGHRLEAVVSSSTTKRLDVLVMGDDATKGLRHAWFDGTWKLGMELVSVTGGDALVAVSRGDGQVHAFWWDSPSDLSASGYGPLWYRRFDGTRWQPAELLAREALYMRWADTTLEQPFDVILEGASPNVFLAARRGLLRLRKVAASTQATVTQRGLRGLVGNVEGLYAEATKLIDTSSARVQAELQHIRQLMLTSSTEASRLAVSANEGSTLVDSPLVVRSDTDAYLTRFPALLGRVTLIRLSDAMEALEQATTTRLELTRPLLDLVRRLVGVKELGLDVTDLTLGGISTVVATGGPRRVVLTATKQLVRESPSVRDLVDKPGLLTDVLSRIDEEPENIRRGLATARYKWTESAYFSTALQHLENTLGLLRALERRLRTRVNAMAGYKGPLARLEQAWAELDKRLKVVDGEVAEARQDTTVARALLAEETVRVAAVNDRRSQVLARHVPFFVYLRPRQFDLTRGDVSRLLDPGYAPDILPEVLASTAAAPPELLSYVELVRDSPLKWFSLAPGLLGGLDRLEVIHRTFVRAQARALQRLPVQYPLVSSRAASPFVQGLSRLLASREDLVARQRLTFVRFQPAILETRTWLELQQSAREQLSLGDLIDTAHGRPDVARDAATLLEHMTKVATGLYQRFSEVLPAIRLEWAEQMSQYDAPVELRDLSRLPRWEEVDVTARREMQLLTDWLFARVVATETEAVSLVNDLVRVGMLVASHAPVNELLSGHVSKPTEARVGGSIELAVDPERVRVGMQVQIRSGSQTVQAVVEDIAASVVRARVLSTSTPTVTLPERASARFADPIRGGHALLPFLDAAW